MPSITHLNGIALVKKKGNTLYVVSDPEGVADESPIIAEGTTTPRMLTERFADVVNVRDFGAVGDGITDDTAAIQAAVDYASSIKKEIKIPSGIYATSSPIVIRSHTFLNGDSMYSTVFRLLDNSNCNVFETDKFSELNESGGDNVENYPNLPINFSLKNFSIDGNRENNFDGGVSSDAYNGGGILIYGRNYSIDSISIKSCAGTGFHSILRQGEKTSSRTNSTWNRTYINHVYVEQTSYEGFVWEGPADNQIDDVTVGIVGQPNATTMEDLGESLLFPGSSIDGVVFVTYDPDDTGPIPKSQGTAEIGFIHSHSCFQGYCVRFSGSSSRLTVENIHAEGGIGNMVIEEGVKGNIDKISTRNNQYGLVSLNRPDVLVQSSSGVTIGRIYVNRSATDVGRTSVRITGRYVLVDSIEILGNGYPGNGLELLSNTHVGNLVCSYLIGENAEGEQSKAVIISNNQSPTIDSIDIFNCDIAIVNASTAGPIVRSGTVQRIPESGANQSTDQIVFEETPWISALQQWGINVYDKGEWKFPKYTGYVLCPVDGRGTVQQLSLSHRMWRTPNINEIKVTPRTADASMGEISFAVTSVDSENVTLLVKIGSSSSSAYNLDVVI